ncbi:MAG: hypothetical protein JO111_19145 [Caulobacteraceae bacterium]|nr:hypothetical protein [Caulobacteraceae bacterium]
MWQTLSFAMQALPQAFPVLHFGASTIVLLIPGAGVAMPAGAGFDFESNDDVAHFTDLPVCGSLQDFASAPPAMAKARPKAKIKARILSSNVTAGPLERSRLERVSASSARYSSPAQSVSNEID